MYLIRNDGGETKKKLNENEHELTLFWAPESRFHYFYHQMLLTVSVPQKYFSIVNLLLLTIYQDLQITYFISIRAQNCPPVF